MPVDKATKLLLAKQDSRITELEKQLTQMRLDLKSAGILHDEPYTPPPVDELAARPKDSPGPKKTKSKVEQIADEKDLFS